MNSSEEQSVEKIIRIIGVLALVFGCYFSLVEAKDLNLVASQI